MNVTIIRVGLMVLASGMVLSTFTGCAAKAPSLYGPGRFHDITEIRRGMSPNEVMRVMGKNYKSIEKEGLEGMDMGISIWEYPEGKVYFNTEGVFKVEPYR